MSDSFHTTPLCSPSRACFLTGQYAHPRGVVDKTARNEQSKRLITFPRLLYEAGYETAYIGKWHMGNDNSPRPGFDRWISFPGQGTYLDPTISDNGTTRWIRGYTTDIFTDRAVRAGENDGQRRKLDNALERPVDSQVLDVAVARSDGNVLYAAIHPNDSSSGPPQFTGALTRVRRGRPPRHSRTSCVRNSVSSP